MTQEFRGTHDFPFCTQNLMSLLMRIFWEQPCHCSQDKSPLSVHYIHPQFPLFGVGWVSGALLYLPGGSVQFPTGMLESRASLLMLCWCCKPRLPSASLGCAAQHCCSPHLCCCWALTLVHKDMEGNEEASPGPQQALNVPFWKPARWGPTCSPLPVTGAVPPADPASAPWQAPSLSWDMSSVITRLNPWGLGEGEEG